MNYIIKNFPMIWYPLLIDRVHLRKNPYFSYCWSNYIDFSACVLYGILWMCYLKIIEVLLVSTKFVIPIFKLFYNCYNNYVFVIEICEATIVYDNNSIN